MKKVLILGIGVGISVIYLLMLSVSLKPAPPSGTQYYCVITYILRNYSRSMNTYATYNGEEFGPTNRECGPNIPPHSPIWTNFAVDSNLGNCISGPYQFWGWVNLWEPAEGWNCCHKKTIQYQGQPYNYFNNPTSGPNPFSRQVSDNSPAYTRGGYCTYASGEIWAWLHPSRVPQGCTNIVFTISGNFMDIYDDDFPFRWEHIQRLNYPPISVTLTEGQWTIKNLKDGPSAWLNPAEPVVLNAKIGLKATVELRIVEEGHPSP
ncbi:MAG: hypothetical protein J7L64_09155 [Acidobacteria bacterium]|nr:hypothetical protein [Acidobacteriota bacterium]